MKYLLKYLKDYKKECVLAPLFKLFEAIFELLIPIVLANIIDKGINGEKGLNYILSMCFLMIGIGIVGYVFAIIAQYFSAKAATGFSKKVRESLFNKLQSLTFKDIDTIGTSTMLNQINSDVNQLQNGVNMFLRLFLRSPFIVFGAMIMSFIINVKAGLVFLIIIFILFIVTFLIIKITKKGYKKIQKKSDIVVLKTRENLVGARVFRAFNKQYEQQKEYNNVLEDLNKQQKRVSILSQLLNPLTYSIINLGIIAVIYIGANGGANMQGSVMALYNYMTQILIELIKLANLIILLSKALASASRISVTLQIKPTLKINDKIIDIDFNNLTIEFKNVYFRYHDDGGYNLTDINFLANTGETIGIIGGTGSGKSTLINLLSHFYDIDKGEITFNGVDIKSISIDALTKNISYVPQKAVLFKGTIRDNLIWRDENATDEELLKALKNAQCDDILLSNKDGLYSKVEQNGSNFSGGQRQRLTIARALVGNPKVLILDDSSSALDYITDLKLRKSIKNTTNPPLTFIVSQRTSAIQSADKIIVLDCGKIVGYGKHKDLLKNCEIYKEIYDSQFKEVE